MFARREEVTATGAITWSISIQEVIWLKSNEYTPESDTTKQIKNLMRAQAEDLNKLFGFSRGIATHSVISMSGISICTISSSV